MLNEVKRHAGHRGKQDAIHRAQRFYVGIGAMGGYRRIERPHQIDQAMGFQAGESDARQIKRINPKILEQGIARRALGGKPLIKGRVVGDHGGIPHKLNKAGAGLIGQRSIRHILVMNVCQARHVLRNRLPRIHKRHEPIGHLSAFHTCGGDLRQFVMMLGKTRRLGVENNHIAIELAKIGAGCHIAERRVALAYIFWRAFGDKVVYTHSLYVAISSILSVSISLARKGLHGTFQRLRCIFRVIRPLCRDR